jgi:uncharacterized protein involved in exopolysaccharide biosynthesis
MYGPMDADRQGGQAHEAASSILRRLRPALLIVGVAAGLGAAAPLAATRFVDLSFRAQTQIAAGNGGQDHIRSAMQELRSKPVLDNVIRALNLGSGDEFSANRPTVSRVVSEVLSGEVTTVSQAEDAVRDRLRNAVSVGYDASGRRIFLDAVANDPAKAATIANRLGDELRRLLVSNDGPMRNPQVEAMRSAAARADATLAGFTAKLDDPTRARLNKLAEDRRAIETDLGNAKQRLADLGEKQKLAAAMTLSDVLAKPLPDSLEFTGLEYERERYVQSELALQQLSVNLGPLHPRRAAAQGAVDGAKRDIGGALRQLSSSLKDELATATTALADLNDRKAALLADRQLNETAKQLSSLQAGAEEARHNLEKLLTGAAVSRPVAVSLPPVLMPATPAGAQRLGPNMTMLAAAGAATGLFAGLVILVLRHRRQSRLADELDDMPVDLDFSEMNLQHSPAAEPFVIDEAVLETAAIFRELPDDHLFVTDEVDDLYLEERIVANDTAFGDRIRSLLADHHQPAEQVDLPPLLAAAVEQSQARFAQQFDRRSIDQSSVDESDDMEELLELQRELAELRELVRLETAARELKATG